MKAITNFLGRALLSVPFFVMGAGHFANAQAMAGLVPGYMPGGIFWIYFVGAALLAAGVSFNLRRHDRLAGLLSALMLALFAALVHLPGMRNAANDMMKMVEAGNFVKDLGLAGGALLLATVAEAPKKKG